MFGCDNVGADFVPHCSNKKSGSHGDHIAYRRGKFINGELYWGEKQILFGPTEGTYYSGNICDPDVIKGEFKYKGETYGWLMTILGCTTVDNSSNMFGFKIAKSPDGPWIDVPEVSPLYNFYDYHPGYVYQEGKNQFIWGWGQSSLISVDKKGKVMLFYTGRSATGQKYEYWDFSDLENPKMLYETNVTAKGLTQINGTPDNMCNAQFMYDQFNDDMYVVCDVHPFEQFEVPTNLPNLSRVYRIENATRGGEMGAFFKDNKKTWEKVLDIDKNLTGFFRNHNCCFYRDPYGWMLEENKLDICYTRCLPGADWKVLYSYRIYHTEYLIA